MNERTVQIELSKARLLLAVYRKNSNVIKELGGGVTDKMIDGHWYNEFIVQPLLIEELVQWDGDRLVPTAPRYIGE